MGYLFVADSKRPAVNVNMATTAKRALLQASSLLLSPLLVGCDAFMVVSQPVEVFVRRASTGEPVASAVVNFLHASVPKEETNEALWKKYAYRERRTDSDGRARLLFDITWIAGGLFADRSTNRDRLSGEKYLFKISASSAEDVMGVQMMSQVTTPGSPFSITVDSIGSPKRRDTDWLRELKNQP